MISLDGIKPMNRNYVHLTNKIETAKNTGLRHAKNLENLVVLKILSKTLIENNIQLFISENLVYQIKYVPFNLVDKIIIYENE